MTCKSLLLAQLLAAGAYLAVPPLPVPVDEPPAVAAPEVDPDVAALLEMMRQHEAHR